MNYKKYKHLIMGMIMGLILAGSMNVYADELKKVTATLMNNIKFELNGEEKTLPKDQNILKYKDKIYVPLKFVGEELNAEVMWEEASNTIKINKELVKSKAYKNTPVEMSNSQVNLEIEDCIYNEEDDEWRLYIKLENKQEDPVKLEQLETKIKIDNKKYSMEDVKYYKIDENWFHDVKEDEILSGYIVLPKIHENPEKMDITLVVVENDENQRKSELEFYVKLQK